MSPRVDIAVTVVPAGLARLGNNWEARVTLMLDPVQPRTGQDGAFELSALPSEILDRVKAGGIKLNVCPMTQDGCPTPGLAPAAMIDVRPVAAHPALESDAARAQLLALWRQCIGANQWDELAKVLPAADPGPTPTPPTAGLGRSNAGLLLALERGRKLLDRMSPKAAARTRAPVTLHTEAQDPTVRLAAAGGGWGAFAASASFSDTPAAEETLTSAARRARIGHALATRQAYLEARAQSPEALLTLIEAATAADRGASPAQAAAALSSAPGTVKFDDLIKEVRDIHTRGTRTDDRSGRPTQSDKQLAQSRFFGVNAYPSLARLFGLIVDLECHLYDPHNQLLAAFAAAHEFDEAETGLTDADADALGRVEGSVGRSGKARYFFLATSFAGRTADPLPFIWTAAKLRSPRPESVQGGHFWPCTREEIDARAIATALRPDTCYEQIDGVLSLGLGSGIGDERHPRFDIVTLDPALAIEGEKQAQIWREKRVAKIKERTAAGLPMVSDWSDTELTNTTLKTGGLILVDRWRDQHAAAACASAGHAKQCVLKCLDGTGTDPIIKDANDLVIGYRIDVATALSGGGRAWRSLMQRRLAFAPKGVNDDNAVTHIGKLTIDQAVTRLYRAANDPDQPGAEKRAEDIRHRVDEGSVRMTQRVKPADNKTYIEEIVLTWDGDPSGLAPGKRREALREGDLDIGMTFNLPKTGEGSLPPPLRFGWRYHFGVRPLYPGGVSLPVARAAARYERMFNGQVALPAAPAETVLVAEAKAGSQTLTVKTVAGFVPNQPLLIGDFGAANAEPVSTHASIVPSGQTITLAEKLKKLHPLGRKVRIAARTHGRTFRRHERIGSPMIAIPESQLTEQRPVPLFPTAGFATVSLTGIMPAEMAEHMVVRSVADPNSPLAARATPAISRRVLMPPSVQQNFAGLHDAFSGGKPVDVAFDEPDLINRMRGQDPVWNRVQLSRPPDGLQTVDFNASWGGFPVMRKSRDSKASDGGTRPEDVADDQVEIVVADPDPHDKRKTWNPLKGAPGGDAVFRLLPAEGTRHRRIPFYPDPVAEALVIGVRRRGTKPPGYVPDGLLTVPLYDQPAGGVVPKGYPDARPLVLDLVRARKRAGKVIDWAGRRPNSLWSYDGSSLQRATNGAAKPPRAVATGARNEPISVRHIEITLEPGEDVDIDIWCVPTEDSLVHVFDVVETAAALAAREGRSSSSDVDVAFRAGLASLAGLRLPNTLRNEAAAPAGPGSLPLPGRTHTLAFVDAIRARLGAGPIPELAAVATLRATHAMDRPLEDNQSIPAFVVPDRSACEGNNPWSLLRTDKEQRDAILAEDGCVADQSNRDPSTWTREAHKDGEIQLVLAGTVLTQHEQCSSLLILAEGASAARGDFDAASRGRTRDDRARGIWPRDYEGKVIGARKLFGFDVYADGRVTLPTDEVRLLEIRGLPLPTGAMDEDRRPINLLSFQREVARREKANEDSPQRVDYFPGLPDGKARKLTLTPVAGARFDELMTTRHGQVVDVRVRRGRGWTQWLPATARPARPSARSLIPSFRWYKFPPLTRRIERTALCGPQPAPPVGYPTEKVSATIFKVERRALVRVRLRRPWFSSGEGERLGLVIWPPHLFDIKPKLLETDVVPRRSEGDETDPPMDIREFSDIDLGPGGRFVSRWGADPTRDGPTPRGWLLSRANFPDWQRWRAQDDSADQANPPDAALIESVIMPVPDDSSTAKVEAPPVPMPGPGPAAPPPAGAPSDQAKPRPLTQFMNVSLLTYEPRFDVEQETWFSDVEINPIDVPNPFVRLGIVRYQPHSKRNLQVSEPVTEWIQVLPARTVQATVEMPDSGAAKDCITLKIEMSGRADLDDELSPYNAAAEAQQVTNEWPIMRVRVLRSEMTESGIEVETTAVGFEGGLLQDDMVPAQRDNTGFKWEKVFRLADNPMASADGAKWSVFVEEIERRRPATYRLEPASSNDPLLVETGPRFAVRVSIAS
jgi:hypothetical protein